MIRSRAGRRWMLVLPLCGTAVLACDRAEPAAEPESQPSGFTAPPAAVSFDTATVTFTSGTGQQVLMPVEIAERNDQRAFGLMDRDELPQDRGMIFLYDDVQPPSAGFWMYRTRIPLDIAYFDGAGRIVAIEQMMPCASLDPSRCPSYSPGVPFFGAVEANRGYFARHAIRVGDSLTLTGRVGG
ncbi:MAG TPA: DUF192 domain-containing protein [Longimicrobiales bacterium]